MDKKLLGYCECCGLEIYKGDVYAVIDGNYYCDYCGGEDGLAISEMSESDDDDFLADLRLEQNEQM